LSRRGQIIIPLRIREQFGWEPGAEFAVEAIHGGIALRPIEELKPTTMEEVCGWLPYRGPRKSLQEMEDGIRNGATERA